MKSIKDKVAIIGMGCTKFGTLWDKSLDDLIIEAAYEAYEDAGIAPKDIQAAWCGTSAGAMGNTLARPLKLNIPISRNENACNTGLDALRNACMGIVSGMYDIVMALGCEKTREAGMRGGGATSPYAHPVIDIRRSFPGGWAFIATRYFHQYGLGYEKGKETLAKIAVKNHHNGSLNPKAHLRRETTIEEAINAPMVAWPLGLFDCCGNSDGAACAILCRADLAKNFNHKDDYILVKGMGMENGSGYGALSSDYDWLHATETMSASKQAYEQVGITNPRKELSLAIVHDCFTSTELLLYEDLGFSPRGKGWEDVDAGTFTLEGEIPVNTDGGLKCFGHPIGASGIRMTYEIYLQLQGRAGLRQLKNPTLGLAHNIGGWIGGGSACGVNIYGTRD